MKHILPDVLRHGLKVVFCGTAAGHKSAAECSYYAGSGNKFWKTLGDIKLTPVIVHFKDFKSVLDYGVGLTDIVKTNSGMDVDIVFEEADSVIVRNKMLKYRPSVVAFTSKRAYMEFSGLKNISYGWQEKSIGNTKCYVLPSPSGAASGFWDILWWQKLAFYLHQL